MQKNVIKKIAPDNDEAIDRLIQLALSGLVVQKTPYGYYFLQSKREATRQDHRFMRHAS